MLILCLSWPARAQHGYGGIAKFASTSKRRNGLGACGYSCHTWTTFTSGCCWWWRSKLIDIMTAININRTNNHMSNDVLMLLLLPLELFTCNFWFVYQMSRKSQMMVKYGLLTRLKVMIFAACSIAWQAFASCLNKNNKNKQWYVTSCQTKIFPRLW